MIIEDFEKQVKVFHSSIRIELQDKIIYFDPFKIKNDVNDADYVFITHSHFDHLSESDLLKVIKGDTVIIFPESIKKDIEKINGVISNSLIGCVPEDEIDLDDIKVEVVRSYNVLKPFHPKKNNWVGYIVEIDGERIFVAGDTDMTEDNKKVKCDIAFLPCGGLYTMDYKEAAELANILKPKVVIPTHYGTVAGNKDDGEKFKKLVDESTICYVLIK